MSGFFAVLMATYVFCQSGAPVVDGKCADAEANKVEMFVLRGDAPCPNWDCAGEVTTLLRIDRDGQTILTVPASAIDRDTLDKLWAALRPTDALRGVPR